MFVQVHCHRKNKEKGLGNSATHNVISFDIDHPPLSDENMERSLFFLQIEETHFQYGKLNSPSCGRGNAAGLAHMPPKNNRLQKI